MTIAIEKRPTNNILFVTFTDPLDPISEFGQAHEAARSFAEQVSGTFYYVIDARELSVKFSDLVMGLGSLRRFPASDRMEVVLIGSGEMVEFAAQAAKQQQYGERTLNVFATPQEAFAFVDGKRSKTKA